MRLLKNNRVLRTLTPVAAREPVPVKAVEPTVPDPRIDALTAKLGELTDYFKSKQAWTIKVATRDGNGYPKTVNATNGLKSWSFEIKRGENNQPDDITAIAASV